MKLFSVAGIILGGILLILAILFPLLRREPSTASGIVFWSDRDGDQDIYRMLADGTGLEQLTNHGMPDVEPVWSLDGRWITFISWRNTIQIFRMHPNGSDLEQLTYSAYYPYYLQWSGDGRWLYYLDNPVDGVEIFRLAADGSSSESLSVYVGSRFGFTTSPDGKSVIVGMYAESGFQEFFLVDESGTVLQQLTQLNAPHRDMHPDWSPTGEWIAFVSEKDGYPNIYRMRPDGSDVQQLTENTRFDGKPSWSADGQWIAFVSERDGNREIYKMQADGSDVERLTHDVAFDDAPNWSPIVDMQWSGRKIGMMGGIVFCGGFLLILGRRYT